MIALLLTVCFFLYLSEAAVDLHTIQWEDEFHRRLPANMSDSHRRLATNYLESIRTKVTPQALEEIIQKNKDYLKRTPFPHAMVDGLFPEDVLLAAAEEIPDNPQATPGGCVKGSTKCFIKDLRQQKKNAFEDESKMGPATLTLFAFMKSPMFVHFLEKLTGIESIVPDPHYRGSGVHQTLSGGFLRLHADFNRYEKYDMHRRVNAFIFLNPNWQDSYGGHLELWSRDLKHCEAKIRPDLGRFVVFSSTDFSYHGHPNPLTCPPNRSRRSLALYYYTHNRPKEECLNNDCYLAHSTLFQTGACKECSDKQCEKFAVYGN